MKKIYIYTLTTLTLWGAASCKRPSEFGTTNNDPTAVRTPVVSALLATVETNLPVYGSTGYAIGEGSYAQYFSETQYPGTSLYAAPATSFVGTYNGDLEDCQNVIGLNQSKNSVAVATIMQQYIYWVLTDSFGDIPYSQALQGLKAITPAYDKQQDIYNGIITKVAAAVASMDGGSVPGDLYYGGDAASWKRAGNSLIMLVSIQASKKVPDAGGIYATAFKAAMSAGAITDNSQNFSLQYNSVYKSPWWSLYNGRTDWAESKTMTDYLKLTNDSRKDVMGGSFSDPALTSGGTVSSDDGVPFGVDRTTANNYIGANSDWALIQRADKRAPASKVDIITAAEVELAVAEAINIGWTTGDLVGTYQHGVNLSFENYGVDDPAASYFSNASVIVTPTPGVENEKNIAVQQWVTAYPNGHMGWNIWRKTGYPVLKPAPAASNSSKLIVRRLTYATSEQTTNGASVTAASAREVGYAPGIDSQDNAVWWDTIGATLHP